VRRIGYLRRLYRDAVAYRGVGGWGVKPPPPEIPKAIQNRAKLLKIAEFRTPKPNKDVRKKRAVKF